MENHTAEAARHFESLTLDEKLMELWFAGRENQQISQEIRLYQREQNGNVAKVVRELNSHLDEHRKENIEVAFVKRWGGRGTAFLGVLILVTGAAAGIADRVW